MNRTELTERLTAVADVLDQHKLGQAADTVRDAIGFLTDDMRRIHDLNEKLYEIKERTRLLNNRLDNLTN